MDTKVNTNKQKKQQIVAELTEKVNKAKTMVFANYQGMTHIQIEQFKKALKKVDAELVIAKNTLVNLALKDSPVKVTKEDFKEPTATVFAYSDPIAPIKELVASFKKLKLPIIKFGVFEGKLLTDAEINRLSTIPSREALLGQLVGGMKAPIYGLHRALSWNLTKLVLTLKAVEKNKQLATSK